MRWRAAFLAARGDSATNEVSCVFHYYKNVLSNIFSHPADPKITLVRDAQTCVKNPINTQPRHTSSFQDLMATSGTTTVFSKTTIKDLMAHVLECYENAKEKIGNIETENLTLPAEDKEKVDEILTVTGHLKTSLEHLKLCVDEIYHEGAEIVYGNASRRQEHNKKRKREYEMKNAGIELQTAPRRGKISEIINNL